MDWQGSFTKLGLKDSVWVCTREVWHSSSHWNHPHEVLCNRKALGIHKPLGERHLRKNSPGVSKGKRKFRLRGKEEEKIVMNLLFYHPHSLLKIGFIYMCVCVSLWVFVLVWRYPWKPKEGIRALGAEVPVGDCELLGFELRAPLLGSKHSPALFVCLRQNCFFSAWLEFTVCLRWLQTQQHLPALGSQDCRCLPAHPTSYPFQQEAVL